MRVLGLFDGIACGKVALNELGINTEKYYSSEINQHSIKVSKKNHSDIEHIGDVKKVRIPKGYNIDLLIAGSPCQGFSFAGRQLNFEDPRSKLFFEFVRILKECRRYNPNVLFMLENVVMLKEHEKVITDILEVNPILIDSALLSAQMRKRLYWTNIENIEQPSNNNLFIKDILDEDVHDSDNTYYKGGFRNYLNDKKITSFLSCNNKEVIVSSEKTYLANERRISKTKGLLEKSTCLTLSSTSIAGSGGVGLFVNNRHRKINRLECERLQGLPDGYTNSVSENQGIQQCGNGWNIPTIKHILKSL